MLAYTGYDMEDAMILNKSSVERGFAHATLYKTEDINLKARVNGLSAPSAPSVHLHQSSALLCVSP